MTAIALSACAKNAEVDQEKQLNPIGPTGKPLIRVSSPDRDTAVASRESLPSNPIIGITPDSDIIYTDPDAPDADIPELTTLLASTKREPWEESETIAKQLSVREGKPLLIWFTSSQNSPMCNAVSQELFSTHEFGDWARKKLVRLKIDATPDRERLGNATDLGTKEDLRIRMLSYAADLKKRYKVMGYPSLVMLSPSGEVVGRYRGYKRGEGEYLWGQLKHAEAVSSQAYKGWRQGLEKKGYREWQDQNQRKIFAKLVSYSKGIMTFIEPDGTRSRTNESKLSEADRTWITEQKKLRNLQ